MAKTKRKVNLQAIGAVIGAVAIFSVVLLVGTAEGSFLLDSTNPPQTRGGWVFGALLPIGTNIDIDGVDFQVNYDGADFFLYEDGSIQDRGTDLIGNNVEVNILDWWFYGMPTHSGIYLANIHVDRPVLSVTRPIVRSAALDSFGDSASDIITPDAALELQIRNYTVNVATDEDMRPMSVVILMIAALEGAGRVEVELDWGEGTITRESFILDSSISPIRPADHITQRSGTAISWCPELHGAIVSEVQAKIYYQGRILTEFTIQNPNVQLASGLTLLGSNFSAQFQNTGETIEQIENQFHTFEEETAEAITDAWNTMYGDITVLRDDFDDKLIDSQEWVVDQLNSFRENTEGALQSVADSLIRMISDLDRRTTVITRRLADPQIQVYAPPVWASGLPNSMSVEAQNATITGITVKDSSGSLFDQLSTSLTAVPLEGDILTIEVEYEPTFPPELWELPESSIQPDLSLVGGTDETRKTTLSFPVNHQTGFYVDFSGNPGFSGLGNGFGVIDVILIAMVFSIVIIVIIIGRGREWF